MLYKIKEKFFSIKLKLIFAYASIIVITLSIFSAVAIWRSDIVVVRLAQQNVEQAILASHQALNSEIDSINALMLSFQVKKEVQDILCSDRHGSALEEIDILEQALLETDIFQTNISNLELYALNRPDYPPLSAGGSVFSSEQMKNDVWFNNVLKQGNSTGWTVRNNINEGNSFIVVSKLLIDFTTNEPVAVLKANVNIRNFTKIIDDVTLGETGRLFISSENHLVDYDTSEIGQHLANSKVLFSDMLRSSQSETRTTSIDGESFLISTHPIKDTGLSLVGAVRIREFLSTRNAIITAIFIAAIMLLLLSLIFIMVVSMMITKPLSVLTQAMRCYEPGCITPVKTDANDEIGVMFSVFNNMQITIKELIDNIEHETLLHQRAELKALQAQITPHFLYNTLNSVCMLAKKYNASDIQQMIMALSKFFMISLSNGAEIITLEQEVEQTQSYMYIQKIRYADRFTLITDIPEDLLQTSICKLTLQPLVENCINHAFADLDEQGIIELAARRENGDIIITVSDNGPDGIVDINELNLQVNKKFDPDEPVEKYGIHNINQRIHLYFGNEYGLSYKKNIPHGLTAEVRIKELKYGENINTNGGRAI